jgi:hypothetical protein
MRGRGTVGDAVAAARHFSFICEMKAASRASAAPPGVVVVEPGVDPGTFRFSGGRSAD